MADLPMMQVGEFLPDHPDRDNPGVLRAENVVPGTNCYRPVRDLAVDYDPLPSRVRGAAPVADSTGAVANFCGTNTDLYELSGNAYVEKSKSTAAYNMQNKHFWSFFGFNGYAFAVGGYQPLQQYISGAFADIVPNPAGNLGAAPDALYGAVVRQFIMTGNQSLNSQEVVWSGLNDHTMWLDAGGDASAANQAGRQVLHDGGAITQVVGGEYGIIFCEHAIFRANYEGSPVVFSFNNVAPGKGTVCPGSVAAVGETIYYLDVDGFYEFNGSSSQPIGSNRVNEWFLQEADLTNNLSIDSMIDLAGTTVYWSYVSHNARYLGVCDRMLAYNWSTQTFSGPIHIETETLVYSRTPGVDVDDEPQGSEDVDTGIYKDILVDAQQFKGGDREVMAAFNSDHQHATTSGPNLEGLVETGEYSFSPHHYTLMSAVRPVVEGLAPVISVALGTKDTTYDMPTWTKDVEPYVRTQECNFRANARYHRLRMKVSGDYEKIVGAEAVVIPMGRQ